MNRYLKWSLLVVILAIFASVFLFMFLPGETVNVNLDQPENPLNVSKNILFFIFIFPVFGFLIFVKALSLLYKLYTKKLYTVLATAPQTRGLTYFALRLNSLLLGKKVTLENVDVVFDVVLEGLGIFLSLAYVIFSFELYYQFFGLAMLFSSQNILGMLFFGVIFTPTFLVTCFVFVRLYLKFSNIKAIQ
ncbi:MAG: hypothetical protein HON47_01090 [Candidatus Diapherotrites archaeon]|jgi:hypothetical protein|uniref:Uncharacterized protein n=1 Tax=Candidatus Iainarchaeum sp. TaxID=3101447 RepID=A0A8T5GDW5_9ARCH|nr:hypothetical protein [Candidatus Diapherotrites archaeon]